MNFISFRTLVATGCAAVVCLLVSPNPSATVADRPFQRFIAMAPFDGDPGSGPARVDIVVERWASSKDREELQDALSRRGPEGLLPGLHAMHLPSGVLLVPGIPNGGARALTRHPTNVWFADQVETPAGRQIVIATDHYLAFGQPTVNWPSDYKFSLLDIRFTADGTGVGKVAPAVNVAYNRKTNALEAANYDTLPVRLIEVKPAKM
jgi:hypothetical protein